MPAPKITPEMKDGPDHFAGDRTVHDTPIGNKMSSTILDDQPQVDSNTAPTATVEEAGAEREWPAPLPTCKPWCRSIHSDHSFDHVGQAWTHDLAVGTFAVVANDLAHEDGVYADGNPGFELLVTADDSTRAMVIMLIEGQGEAVEMTAEQARHASALFAQAAELLERA